MDEPCDVSTDPVIAAWAKMRGIPANAGITLERLDIPTADHVEFLMRRGRAFALRRVGVEEMMDWPGASNWHAIRVLDELLRKLEQIEANPPGG